MSNKGAEIVMKNIGVYNGSMFVNDARFEGIEKSGYMSLENVICKSISPECKKINVKILIQEIDTESTIEIRKIDLEEKIRELQSMLEEMEGGE